MTTPRVNAAMLPQCVGKRVLLVGKVIGRSQDGELAQVQAPDGASVNVRLVTSEVLENQTYEFFGTVEQDNSITEGARTPFSENFDLTAYNKLVTLAHNPRFSNLFWG